MSDQIECVYLVGCEVSARVKIGRSIDVQARLAALQTMSPVRLTLLWQTLGGAELEVALHRWFESRRSHGEWFDFPDGDAVAQVTQALPEIAAEMQRVQRRQVARMAQQAKAVVQAAPAKPTEDTRAKARKLLRETPDMNAAELARALGRNPAGCYRTMRGELLEELRDAGEFPSVQAIDDVAPAETEERMDDMVAQKALAAIAAGEPVVPWEDVKARLDLDDEPTH